VRFRAVTGWRFWVVSLLGVVDLQGLRVLLMSGVVPTWAPLPVPKGARPAARKGLACLEGVVSSVWLVLYLLGGLYALVSLNGASCEALSSSSLRGVLDHWGGECVSSLVCSSVGCILSPSGLLEPSSGAVFVSLCLCLGRLWLSMSDMWSSWRETRGGRAVWDQGQVR